MYETEPQSEPVTIAGPVSAVLYAASSAVDTDWVLRLAKIDKQQKPFLLCHGIIRPLSRLVRRAEPARARQPLRIPHRHVADRCDDRRWGELVLVVSSALFPTFSRNLNTGGNNEMETEHVRAEQTIFHDEDLPSHVLLPVIPNPSLHTRRQESRRCGKRPKFGSTRPMNLALASLATYRNGRSALSAA